jgi:hypothetical protein
MFYVDNMTKKAEEAVPGEVPPSQRFTGSGCSVTEGAVRGLLLVRADQLVSLLANGILLSAQKGQGQSRRSCLVLLFFCSTVTACTMSIYMSYVYGHLLYDDSAA